jgi:hypothetical protein
MPTKITIVWRDESREPLKTEVELWSAEGSFIRLELPHDLIPAGAESKELVFPFDLIASMEVVDYSEQEDQRPGYREESTFRETPAKSRWFRGMGPPEESES